MRARERERKGERGQEKPIKMMKDLRGDETPPALAIGKGRRAEKQRDRERERTANREKQ